MHVCVREILFFCVREREREILCMVVVERYCFFACVRERES